MDSKQNFKTIFSSFHLRLMALIGLTLGNSLIHIYTPQLQAFENTVDAPASIYYGYQIGYILYYAALPIGAFLIVTGVKKTSSVLHYLIRLGIAAMVTQVSFCAAKYGADFSLWVKDGLNLYFTYILGMLSVALMEKVIKVKWPKGTVRYNVFNILVIILALVVGELSRVERGGLGVLMIIAFYMFYESRYISLLAVAALMIVTLGSAGGFIMYAPVLGVLATWFYNGERGKDTPVLRGMFYIVYPVVFVLLVNYLKSAGLL